MSFLTRGKPKTSGQSGTATSQIDPRAFSGWGKDEEIPGYEWVASEFKDLYDKGYQPFQQKNEFGQMVDVTGMDMMGGGPNKWDQIQQTGMEQMYDPAMNRFGSADKWVKGVGDRDVRLAGGVDAPSFLTGYGPGGQISDYKKALGFDRAGAEKIWDMDTERAMALARMGEGDMAHQMMGSGGGDPSTLRSGTALGEAYGRVAADRGRMGWQYDENAREQAIRAMGDDIARRDMRIAQDEGALALKDQINLATASQYADPSQRMNFLRGYGDVGARERAIKQGAMGYDLGVHQDKSGGYKKDMLGQYAGLLGEVPFNETTIQDLQQTEKGRSILANLFGIAGGVAGGYFGSALGPMGTFGGATAGFTAGSQLGDSLFG